MLAFQLLLAQFFASLQAFLPSLTQTSRNRHKTLSAKSASIRRALTSKSYKNSL